MPLAAGEIAGVTVMHNDVVKYCTAVLMLSGEPKNKIEANIMLKTRFPYVFDCVDQHPCYAYGIWEHFGRGGSHPCRRKGVATDCCSAGH